MSDLQWWTLADVFHDRNESIAETVGHCNHVQSPPECIADAQRTAADYNRRLSEDALDSVERLARAIFEAERPDRHWPTWEEYLASFANGLTQRDVWFRKAERLLAVLDATPGPQIKERGTNRAALAKRLGAR